MTTRSILSVLFINFLLALSAGAQDRTAKEFDGFKLGVPFGDQIPKCAERSEDDSKTERCWQWSSLKNTRIVYMSYKINGNRQNSHNVSVLLPAGVSVESDDDIARLATVELVQVEYSSERTKEVAAALKAKRGEPTRCSEGSTATILGSKTTQITCEWVMPWGAIILQAPGDELTTIKVWAYTKAFDAVFADQKRSEQKTLQDKF